MQRIAIISDHASPLTPAGSVDSGGQNIYVAQIARRLCELGHDVDVFTRRDGAHQPPVFEWFPGLRVVHVPAGPARPLPKEELLPTMDEFGAFLYRFIRREGRPYDVLHANFFMSGLAARHSAKAFDIPLVMTFHALGRVRRLHQRGADRFPVQRLEIEDDLVHCADRIVAECPQDRCDLTTLYRADPAKLDTIPCGFDPAELPEMTRTHARHVLGWDPQRFTLLQLGRIVPRKGIENVIRALERLQRVHGRDATLYVVGGNTEHPDPAATPEIGRLQRLAADLGVSADVRFLGRRGRECLSYLYRAADVFVTTPWYEPFGITPVEAMACGVPVVGSAVGGIRTTVVDGITGRLVPPEDPVALARALDHFARQPEEREACGRAGWLRAHRLYTWDRIARETLRCYRRAALAHARRGDRIAPLPTAVPALQAAV